MRSRCSVVGCALSPLCSYSLEKGNAFCLTLPAVQSAFVNQPSGTEWVTLHHRTVAEGQWAEKKEKTAMSHFRDTHHSRVHRLDTKHPCICDSPMTLTALEQGGAEVDAQQQEAQQPHEERHCSLCCWIPWSARMTRSQNATVSRGTTMHYDLLNPRHTRRCSDGHGFVWATDRSCKHRSSTHLAIVRSSLARRPGNRSILSGNANPSTTETVLQNGDAVIELSYLLSSSRICFLLRS